MTDMIKALTAGSKPAPKTPRRMAREPEALPPALAELRVNKSDLVIGLLQRPGGATLDVLVAATCWLSHSARAAITGLKKKGHLVTSEKADGVRRYRIQSSNA